MAEEQRRDFGRDGVSGMVTRERALRARLLPQPNPVEREAARRRVSAGSSSAPAVRFSGPEADVAPRR